MTALTTSIGTLTGRVTRRIDRLSDRKFALLSFLPGGLLVALFVIPPILVVFGMSAFRIELLKTNEITANFPNNFTRLANDSEFLASIPRTFIIGIGVTLLTLPLALITALILNRPFRGAAILGLAVLLPWAVAGSVTGLFWKFIFQSHFGLATSVATVLGLTDKPIDWLFNTTFAITVGILAIAWKSVPLFALLLLAALKTIPASLYRAAKMDGANAWQCFRWVTLPGISRMLLVVTVLIVIGALQVLDVIFTLTRGGPGRATTVMIYYIYQSTTEFLSFGYGAAMAIFLLLVTLACASVVWLIRISGTRPVSVDEDTAELSRSTTRLTMRSTPQPAAQTSRPPSTASAAAEAERTRRRIRLPPWLGRAGIGIVTVLLIIWLVGPIIWIFISSVTPEGHITATPPRLGTLTLKSYSDLLANPAWGGSAVVSLQVTILVTLITLVLGALAAYPLARLDIPGKGLIIALIVITQTVPSIVLAIPTLFIFRGVGLSDTLAGLVLVNVAFLLPLVIWLLKNVFESVPRALESAARIDGCSRLGALFRVTLPAASPGISAIVILCLIAVWNEFTFAVILGSRNTVTLTRQIGFIDTISGPTGSPPFTVLAAAGIIAILPCLVLVFLFHRRVVAGITQGFVKG